MAKEYDLKRKAKDYEERARKAEKSSSSRRGGPTSGEVSRLYEQAGNFFADGESYKSARENLQKAYENAYDNSVQKRIQDKIDNLPLEKHSKRRRVKPGRLERSIALTAILSLVSALFFSVFSLTGSVIQGLNSSNSRWIGIVLFIIGLVFTFLYNKIKK